MEDIKQENYQTNNEVIQLLEYSYNNIYQYQVCKGKSKVPGIPGHCTDYGVREIKNRVTENFAQSQFFRALDKGKN